MSSAPILFGPVHCAIGGIDQRYGRGCIVRIKGDADAGAETALLAARQIDRRQEEVPQLDRDGVGIVPGRLTVNAGEDDYKFIAADARDGIGVAYGFEQSSGDDAEHVIAGFMAVSV